MSMERSRPSYELEASIARAYASTFIARFDRYALQKRSKRGYWQCPKPLTSELISAHFRGDQTLGAYAVDIDGMAHWICFDADNADNFELLKKVARNLQNDGFQGYLEQSSRGGHFWLFLPLLKAQDAQRLGTQLAVEAGLPAFKDGELELYPKSPLSFVRLPLGIHQKTGKRYFFITPSGEPLAPTIREQVKLLTTPQRLTEAFIAYLLSKAPEKIEILPSPSFEQLRDAQGEVLSEVLKSRISVYDFVSQFVNLDGRGRGLCPFHDDREKSFSVHPTGNYWRCFAGCGGGSIIDFWMRWRSAHGQDGSFTSTVKDLKDLLL
jgi:hypothetical protein